MNKALPCRCSYCTIFLLAGLLIFIRAPQNTFAAVADEFSHEVRSRLSEVGSILEGMDEQNENLGFQALQTTFGILGTTNEIINSIVEKAVDIYLASLFRPVRIAIEATDQMLEFEMAFRRAAFYMISEEIKNQLPNFISDPAIDEKLDHVTFHLYNAFTEADSKVSKNQQALTNALDEFYKAAYAKARTGSSDAAKLGLLLKDANELRQMYRFTSWVTKGIAGQMASTNASFWVGLKRWSPLVISRTSMTAGKAASTAIGGVLFVADVSGAGGTAVHYHKAEPLLKESYRTLLILSQLQGQGNSKTGDHQNIRHLVNALEQYRDAVEHFETVFRSDKWYHFVKKGFLWLSLRSREYREAADEFGNLKAELDGRIAYWKGVTLTPQPSKKVAGQSVLLILDTSASMAHKAKGAHIPKIDAAKDALKKVLLSSKAKEMGWALMIYEGCSRTPVIAPSGGGFTHDKNRILSTLPAFKPFGSTPLALSILNAGRYLRNQAADRSVQIVLLSDGMETCKGDPVAAARKVTTGNLSALDPASFIAQLLGPSPAFAQSGSLQISINVIGFDIKKGSKEEAQLNQIANAGKGKYYSADKVADLTKSMEKATGVVPDDGPFKKRVFKEIEY